MEKAEKKKPLARPVVWCATTYFAEGFPYSLIRTVSTTYFTTIGASLEKIGLTSLFGIPWALKFLWGPQVDAYSSKRRWMLSAQGLVVAVMFAAAAAALLPDAAGWVGMLFFVGAFLAATQDIAIDGYYMAALDKDGQARFVGYRIMAYRLAMVTGSMLIVRIGTHGSWFAAFLAASFIMLLFFLYHLFFLPEAEKPAKPLGQLFTRLLLSKTSIVLLALAVILAAWALLSPLRLPPATLLEGNAFPTFVALLLLALLVLAALFGKILLRRLTQNRENFFVRAYLSFMDQPKIGFLLAFIILIRSGEWLQSNMSIPFLKGLGLERHLWWITSIFGVVFTIFGAMIGGMLISRLSLKRTIWPMLILQNLTSLGYMALAYAFGKYLALNAAVTVASAASKPLFLNPKAVASLHAVTPPLPALLVIALALGCDQLTSGMGNAVLVTIVMRACKPEFKATHFAIGSGLWNVTAVYAGVASGFLAARFGFGLFFGIAFLASLPGMIAILGVPKD